MTETLRAFLALDVPEGPRGDLLAALHRMRALAERRGARVRWAKPDQLHVTVAFLGQVETRLVSDIAAVALRRATALPIDSALGAPTAFGGVSRARALVVDIADPDRALADLQKTLSGDLLRLGISLEDRAFRPHITLGRPKDVAEDDVEALLRAAHLRETRCVFDALCLIRSDLGPDGSVYTELARAP